MKTQLVTASAVVLLALNAKARLVHIIPKPQPPPEAETTVTVWDATIDYLIRH